MSHIDIVFDRFPDAEGADFIEVENSDGASIKFGEWVQREDGTVAIRLGADHEGMEVQLGVQARKLNHAKSELQGLLDSLDDHITQDEIYSAIKTIKEEL